MFVSCTSSNLARMSALRRCKVCHQKWIFESTNILRTVRPKSERKWQSSTSLSTVFCEPDVPDQSRQAVATCMVPFCDGPGQLFVYRPKKISSSSSSQVKRFHAHLRTPEIVHQCRSHCGVVLIGMPLVKQSMKELKSANGGGAGRREEEEAGKKTSTTKNK